MGSIVKIVCDTLNSFDKVLHFLKTAGYLDMYNFTYTSIRMIDMHNHLDHFISLLEEIKMILDRLYVEKTQRALDDKACRYIENVSNCTQSLHITPPSTLEERSNCEILNSCRLSTGELVKESHFLLTGYPSDLEQSKEASILDLDMSEFLHGANIRKDMSDGLVGIQDDCILSNTDHLGAFSVVDPGNKPLSDLIDSISQSGHQNRYKDTTCHLLDDHALIDHNNHTLDDPQNILINSDISQNAVSVQLPCLQETDDQLMCSYNAFSKEIEPLIQAPPSLTLPQQKSDAQNSGFLMYIDNFTEIEMNKAKNNERMYNSCSEISMMLGDEGEGDLPPSASPEKMSMSQNFNAKDIWEGALNNEEKKSDSCKNKNQCGICDKVFGSNKALTHHTRSHAGSNKTLCCEFCGKLFSSKSTLNDHCMKQHDSGVSCSECGKVFARKRALASHIIDEHRGVKSFPCHICHATFPQEIARDTHLLVHADLGDQNFNSKIWDGPENDKDRQDSLDKKKFQCDICTKVLTSKRNLINHIKSHTGSNKTLCCEHCGKLFSSKSTLLAHSMRQHNINTEQGVSCSECGKIFAKKRALALHIMRHKGVRPFSCHICHKTFTQKVTRDTHVLVHTRELGFSCSLCGKKFTLKSKLKLHLKTHKEPEFTCSLCQKKFATFAYFKAHLETHNVTTLISQCLLESITSENMQLNAFSKPHCSLCDLTFKSRRALTQHNNYKHNPSKPVFRCTVPDCKSPVKTFPMKREFDNHNEVHHNPNRKMHSCSHCEAQFLDPRSLTHHEYRKHSGVPPPLHRCPMCSKVFSHKAKLSAHVRTHTEGPQYSCVTCSAKFYRNDILKRHMKTHVSNRLKCKECGTEFFNAEDLNSHKNLHCKPVLLSCSECNKTFSTKFSLTSHMRAHNQHFNFSCETCGKKFVRKCHYQQHLLTHSTSRSVKCHICGGSFKTQKNWKEHVKLLHPQHYPPPIIEQAPPPQEPSSYSDDLGHIIGSEADVRFCISEF